MQIAAASKAGPRGGFTGPATFIALGAVALLAIALGINALIDDYRDSIALKGLGGKPLPVSLIVAGEPLVIPANMIRFRSERRGGAVDRVDLVVHWPSLEGFSDEHAEDFKDTVPNAPLLYLTISGRETALDATTRLDAVYSRYFEGPEVKGPSGLVGRALAPDSGYRGELVFYYPKGVAPFVARCIAEETPDIPATCIRDVNVGQGLSMLYRFNTSRLAEWRMMDSGLTQLVAGFVPTR